MTLWWWLGLGLLVAATAVNEWTRRRWMKVRREADELLRENRRIQAANENLLAKIEELMARIEQRQLDDSGIPEQAERLLDELWDDDPPANAGG